MKRLGDHHDVASFVRERLEADACATPEREAPGMSRAGTALLILAVLASLTVVQGAAAAYDNLTAPTMNAACRHHGDCGEGESCLMHLPLSDRYCTRSCTVSSDCPTGMSCGDVGGIDYANRGVGAAGPVAAAPACLRE